ncbi:hypothetical protein BKA70DRAFT_1224310 [Coprinopsis sp. MPI-PUGE-AT-0042]|nr:hypothetical protein BKA70DRAFT_1224310 [Coprinopsis sp. MPI-PUGE-AT-0042]
MFRSLMDLAFFVLLLLFGVVSVGGRTISESDDRARRADSKLYMPNGQLRVYRVLLFKGFTLSGVLASSMASPQSSSFSPLKPLPIEKESGGGLELSDMVALGVGIAVLGVPSAVAAILAIWNQLSK